MKKFPIGIAFIISVVIFVVSIATLLFIYFGENSYVTPLPGGTYREGVVGRLTDINPLLATVDTPTGDAVTLVFSGLTKYDPRQDKVVPDLATFESSKDYKTHTFFINPKALWHDGEPVTADDVVFTYEYIARPDFPNKVLQKSFTGVKVEKVDDHTVKFILDEPYVFFPTLTTLGIIPKHIWENVPEGEFKDQVGNMPVIGSGPYQYDAERSTTGDGEKMASFRRFENYFEAKPYIDVVELHVFDSDATLLSKRNSLDAVYTNSQEVYDSLAESNRFHIQKSKTKQYFAAFLNFESTQLSKTKTRLGLGLALDRDLAKGDEELLEDINTPFVTYNSDLWETAYDPEKAKGALFDEGFRFPDDAQMEQKKRDVVWEVMSGALMAETAKNTVVQEQTEPEQESRNTLTAEVGTNENSNSAETNNNTNDAEAKDNSNLNLNANGDTNSNTNQEEKKPSLKDTFDVDSIDISNMTYNGKRVVDILSDYKKYRHDQDGKPLHVKLVTVESPQYLRHTALYMKDEWEKIGVSVDLKVLTNDEADTVLKNRDYDVILLGEELGYDGDIFPYWHSSTARLSGRNLSNIKNDKLDDLLLQLRAPVVKGDKTVDDTIAEIKDKISRLFIDEMPAIFFYATDEVYAVDERVKNVYIGNFVSPRDRYVHFPEWYINEGKNPKSGMTPSEFFSWLISKLRS